MKERCRKGIPPSLRGRAWQRLSGGTKLLEANIGLFDVSTDVGMNEGGRGTLTCVSGTCSGTCSVCF